MAEIIVAQGVGKMYRLGEALAYRVLRERIAELIAAPFRRRGNGPGDEILWALKDVDFTINESEVIGLIGKNGAGKSTLLKILSRITEPTEGRIDLYGKASSLLEVGIGFHPELSGRENIYLNGAILGMSRQEIRGKFDELVEFAEISRFLDTPVKRYSSGMYVRLAFAVAAHLEPDILIVDEVLAVGDAAFQRKCLGKMRSMRSQGRTVILVSHTMPTISSLCQKVIWLDGGRVRAIGPTAAIISQYLNEGVQNDLVWSPRHSSHREFEYHSVSVVAANARDDNQDFFPADAAIDVIYDFTVTETLPAARLFLQLRNELGETLFVSSSADGRGGRITPMTPGRRKMGCRIPGNFLAPGRYSITVNHPFGTYDTIHENIITFTVNEQNSTVPRENPEAKLAPLLEWRDV